MTPRERAIDCRTDIELDGVELPSAPRALVERSIEHAITADRQEIQAEIVKRIETRSSEIKNHPTLPSFAAVMLDHAIEDVQSVFAQSSPAEEKPEEKHYCGCAFYQGHVITLCSAHGRIELEKRVLAEREACLRSIREQRRGFEVLLAHSTSVHERELGSVIQSLKEVEEQIRSRSNPAPEAKPEEAANKGRIEPHAFVGDSSEANYCEKCFLGSWERIHWPIANEAPEENAKTKTLDSDRIRQLHETIGEQLSTITMLQGWLRKDTDVITALRRCCTEQAEKIARLEKELQRHEAKETIKHVYSHCGSSGCPACIAGIPQ